VRGLRLPSSAPTASACKLSTIMFCASPHYPAPAFSIGCVPQPNRSGRDDVPGVEFRNAGCLARDPSQDVDLHWVRKGMGDGVGDDLENGVSAEVRKWSISGFYKLPKPLNRTRIESRFCIEGRGLGLQDWVFQPMYLQP
jgi:hypothetical protein